MDINRLLPFSLPPSLSTSSLAALAALSSSSIVESPGPRALPLPTPFCKGFEFPSHPTAAIFHLAFPSITGRQDHGRPSPGGRRSGAAPIAELQQHSSGGGIARRSSISAHGPSQ